MVTAHEGGWLSTLVAAPFVDWQHPRGRRGRFIEVGSPVNVAGGAGRERRGTITALSPAGPEVLYPEGDVEVVPLADASSRIDEAPAAVGRVPGVASSDLSDLLALNSRTDYAGVRSGAAAMSALFNDALADVAGDTDLAVQVSSFIVSADETGKQFGFLDIAVRDAEGNRVGRAERTFSVGTDGSLEVEHALMKIQRARQGTGLGSRLNRAMESVYAEQGVKRIRLEANIDVGGYAWAKAGYDWDYRMSGAQKVIGILLSDDPPPPPEHKKQINDWAELFRNERPRDWPTPYEVAMLGWSEGATTWFGKELMLGSNWRAVKNL